MPLGDEQRVKKSLRVSVEVPRGIFSNDEIILEKLKSAKEFGITEAWAGTLDGIVLIQKAGLKPNAFIGSNVFNSLSVKTLEGMGINKILLSPELTLAQAQAIGGDVPRGVFAYGRLPLMLTRNCPQKNGKSCAECKRTGKLTDRREIEFSIDCRSGCSEILNSVPIYMADRLSEIRNMEEPPDKKLRYDKYFFINRTKDGKLAFKRNDEAIDARIAQCGFFLIAETDFKKTTAEILDIYRHRDVIEKCFDDLKNETDMKRLRTQSGETARGKLFVVFIAQIVRAYMLNNLTYYMRKNTCTMKKILNELDKIKCFAPRPTSSRLIDPLTKNQRKLYSLLTIFPPECIG